MMNIILKIIGLLSGGIGEKVGRGVANGVSLVALLPVFYFFFDPGNSEKVLTVITVTRGEAAVMGLVAVFILKLVHWTAQPRGPA